MPHCDEFSDEIQGKSVEMVSFLASNLEKVSVDYKAWKTQYKCRICGQFWEEAFIQGGHGEYPVVRKITP